MATEIWKGNICYSLSRTQLRTVEGGYLVWEDGLSAGVFETLPERYASLPVTDWGDKLIVPGLCDLHIHAPQYPHRALGLDMELIDWLNTRAFPEEEKYENPEYARRAYHVFAGCLKRGATTRACVFASRHVEATKILMEELEQAGIYAYVGKVNMDRNSTPRLQEASAGQSLANTRAWLEETLGSYRRVKPILTPRFIPSCTDELLYGLAALQREYKLPMQSHLSENRGEIAWVKELCPTSRFYGDAYDSYGLFGSEGPAIMAHCVSSEEEERRLMKQRGVFIAHCPASNTNLSSGIAPMRIYFEVEQNMGLGSDIAASHTDSIFRAMTDAIQMSKLYWRYVDDTKKPLTAAEAFWLGTCGGGAFFGRVGSFEPGYEQDALIIDDSGIDIVDPLSLQDRLERVMYLSDDRHLVAKYSGGERVF